MNRDVKTEEGHKFIMSGFLGDCCSTSMCGLDLGLPLPLPRFQAWLRAFKAVNVQALRALEASSRLKALETRERYRGPNGVHFLRTPLDQWFAVCGELNITKAINEDGSGHWKEPVHQDGGASILHMGVTLYGRRRLVCHQGFGEPDVILDNVPGTVYLGQLTGPEHQVLHQHADDDELLLVPGEGKCSVTVMLRTGLFPHCRSRLRNTTPSPVKLFRSWAESFRISVASGLWRLPTLAECQTALATVEASAGSSCSAAGGAVEPAAVAEGKALDPLAVAKKVQKRIAQKSSGVRGAKRRR
jgi:hypothetical protein